MPRPDLTDMTKATHHSCTRCGADSLQAGTGLCEGCVDWLESKSSLSDADVVEAIRFETPPLVSEDRVVITIGAAITPVLVSLFFGTHLVLKHYDRVASGFTTDALLSVTVLLWLASVGTLTTLVLTAMGARRRPLAYAITALIGTVSLLVVMLVACLFPKELGLIAPLDYENLLDVQSTFYLFHRPLEGIWVFHLCLQAGCALMLMAPVAIAWLRARGISAARQELILIQANEHPA